MALALLSRTSGFPDVPDEGCHTPRPTGISVASGADTRPPTQVRCDARCPGPIREFVSRNREAMRGQPPDNRQETEPGITLFAACVIGQFLSLVKTVVSFKDFLTGKEPLTNLPPRILAASLVLTEFWVVDAAAFSAAGIRRGVSEFPSKLPGHIKSLVGHPRTAAGMKLLERGIHVVIAVLDGYLVSAVLLIMVFLYDYCTRTRLRQV